MWTAALLLKNSTRIKVLEDDKKYTDIIEGGPGAGKL